LAELNKYTLHYEYIHTFMTKIKADLSLERPEMIPREEMILTKVTENLNKKKL